MMEFLYAFGGLAFGFIIGVEFWKRRSILGYGNGFRDGLEEGLMYEETENK